MELRQLEHFVATADFGSTNRAAEALHTSQPNVSKVVASLEKELGVELFIRTSRGVNLTPQGRKLYEYAKTVLKNTEIMKCIARDQSGQAFRVSTYPSHMISRAFCDLYNSRSEWHSELVLREGTTEEVTEHVASGLSEIGVLYIAESQKHCFEHILGHHHLKFCSLAKKPPCVYAGRFSPIFGRKSVKFSDLQNLKFVHSAKDFFSMEHHLDRISVGIIGMEQMRGAVETNCDHLTIDLLLHSDLCCFGIRFMAPQYEQYDIHTVEIEDGEHCLLIGYIHQKDAELSGEACDFLKLLQAALDEDSKSYNA